MKRVFPKIIAEAGINHDGDLKKAKELVAAAAEAKADYIKFQTHFPDDEMLKTQATADYIGDSLYNILDKTKLSKEEHYILKEYADSYGITFISTPFSREAADFLFEMGVPMFKIGSGEMTNLPLIRHIAQKNLPMLISTGMSVMDEISETYNFVRKINPKITLMHCTSTYPTKYEDVNLGVIPILKEKFGVSVGLSDHSPGIYTALAAVVFGVSIIEKHFTIDKNWPGPDQKASIVPDELRELVHGVKAIALALGDKKGVSEEEKEVQKIARESVVSVKDIKKGSIVTEDMIWVKRPGTGIPAKYLPKVVGKRAKKDIFADQLLRWEYLDD